MKTNYFKIISYFYLLIYINLSLGIYLIKNKFKLMSKTQAIFNPQKKVLHHLGTVLEYLEGKNTDPINLEIDPSNACNHSCPFCISGHIHLSKFKGTEFFNRQMMHKDVLMSLVKDLSKTQVKSVSWTGGENQQ